MVGWKRWSELWITGSENRQHIPVIVLICMKDKDVPEKNMFSLKDWYHIIHLFFLCLKYLHFMLLMDEIQWVVQPPEASQPELTGCPAVSGAALSFCAGARSGVRHTGEMGGRNPKANHLTCMKPCKKWVNYQPQPVDMIIIPLFATGFINPRWLKVWDFFLNHQP